MAMVGTMVRDHMYEASIAKITASASGTNKNFATPDRKNMGINTMQMHNVETNAGTAICCAPSRMACTVSLPMARLRLIFSISTVASSTRMPTASASPPSVMMLMVSPSALRHSTLTRMDSGIEAAMISVLFQLPKNTRIMNAVRHAAISASRKHAVNGSAHKQRLVEQHGDVQAFGYGAGVIRNGLFDAAHDIQR